MVSKGFFSIEGKFVFETCIILTISLKVHYKKIPCVGFDKYLFVEVLF